VRVAIAGTNLTPAWANIFWFQLATSSTISQADLDAWLVLVANQYKTNFAPRQTSNIGYKQATATLFVPGGSVLQSSSVMTGAGTNAGGNLADSSGCAVISWLTGVYWRGGKPRSYFAGIPTTDVSGSNILSGGAITNWQTAGNNFRTACNAFTQGTITSTLLGFVSFNSGNAPRTTPIFFSFNAAKVHPRLGTQRRRLGKWSV
jgi:hypothetical protein